MNKSIFALSTVMMAMACNIQAAQLSQTITATTPITAHKTTMTAGQTTKPVYLMSIRLSAAEKNKINRFQPHTTPTIALDSALPKQIQLGMNNVPVLDQGRHGTCVTFAMSAAIDAILGKGDYVSQLCSLELGSYLEKRSYLPSGWDGSWGNLILNQIIEFGVINKDTQRNVGCSGMTEYPRDQAANVGNPMTLDEYKEHSENVVENLAGVTLLSVPQRMLWSEKELPTSMHKALLNVKKALAENNDANPLRVVFGTLLPVQHCMAGACAKFHQTNDTWALTTEIRNDANPELGGHEMVIIGFDDQATAIDTDGVKHTGLLTLRNSWGNDVGDAGNFYMTYDFFEKYAIEARRVQYIKDGI